MQVFAAPATVQSIGVVRPVVRTGPCDVAAAAGCATARAAAPPESVNMLRAAAIAQRRVLKFSLPLSLPLR